jgi:hypothetical protein
LRQRAVAQRPLRQNFRIVLRPAMRDNNLTIRQVRWSLDGSGSAPGIRSWARAYGVGSLNGRRIGHELHLSRRPVTVLSQSHRSCMICGSETASTFIIMSMGAWISGGTKDFLISLTLHISRHIIRHIWMSAHKKKKSGPRKCASWRIAPGNALRCPLPLGSRALAVPKVARHLYYSVSYSPVFCLAHLEVVTR